MEDDFDRIDREIQEYNKTVGYGFASKLEQLLKDSEKRKNADPKSAETRHWAVVFTQLENTLAYVKTYLGGPDAR